MTRDEFNAQIAAIGTCEDDAQRRQLLTDLSAAVGQDYDRIDELTSANETLTVDNESLRGYNMKLFLQVSDQKSAAEQKKSKTGIDDESEKLDLKYEDLFDEKGELK